MPGFRKELASTKSSLYFIVYVCFSFYNVHIVIVVCYSVICKVAMPGSPHPLGCTVQIQTELLPYQLWLIYE